jgi:hypothetical protein
MMVAVVVGSGKWWRTGGEVGQWVTNQPQCGAVLYCTVSGGVGPFKASKFSACALSCTWP